MKLKIFKITQSKTQNLYTKAFTWTGISFLLICLIGYIIALSFGGIGFFTTANRFDFSIYKNLSILSIFSWVGLGLIFLSSGLSIYWYIKFTKVSKQFIYTAYFVYILAQGIGFGFLFLTWNATEILAVFGIAGGIFAVMAIFGYLAKNLSGLWPFLIAGTIISIILGLVSFGLWFAGIYNDTLMLVLYGITGILTMLWTSFDMWRLKRTAEWLKLNEASEDLTFKLAAFFGYRLLVDLISMILIVFLFLRRIRR